jgi:hypothetical protein
VTARGRDHPLSQRAKQATESQPRPAAEAVTSQRADGVSSLHHHLRGHRWASLTPKSKIPDPTVGIRDEPAARGHVVPPWFAEPGARPPLGSGDGDQPGGTRSDRRRSVRAAGSEASRRGFSVRVAALPRLSEPSEASPLLLFNAFGGGDHRCGLWQRAMLCGGLIDAFPTPVKPKSEPTQLQLTPPGVGPYGSAPEFASELA